MNIYHALGKWPEAIAAGRRALEADAEDEALHEDVAFLLTQQGRTREAGELLEQARRRWPRSPLILQAIAWNLSTEGNMVIGKRKSSLPHRRERREIDLHYLSSEGMVACNPRDREAAHRAEVEGIATEDRTAVTCKKCLAVIRRLAKERRA